MKRLAYDSAARFVVPVMLENVLTTAIGLFFSYYIGQISGSALSTMGVGNQVVALLVAAATMLVTGSGILCARLVGAGQPGEAARVIEQTLLLTILASSAAVLACLLAARPLMRLLMPNTDAAMLNEGLAFFRVLIVSLPFLLLTNVLSGILRAFGDSKAPMVIAVLVNLTQLLFAFLFLRLGKMGMAGAGLAYLGSRLCGASLALFIVLNNPHRFAIQPRRLLKPDPAAFRRILRVGLPTSVESLFVQTGYLVANAMVIGLGAREAAAYNVANTLYTFAALPQGICSTVAMPFIGRLIGARDFGKAKKTGWMIWAVGMGFSFLLSGLVLAFGDELAPLYSADPLVLSAMGPLLWAVFAMCVPAISLNTLDPQLRVGGDVRYVMLVTIVAVWAIRLPLTYWFCYRLGLGAAGVFWANTLSLSFRMVFNMIRFIGGKYLTMRV